jgi:hypothetical protein
MCLSSSPIDTLEQILATWRSGYAAACKAVYTGSTPVVASIRKTCKSAVLGLRGDGRETPKTAKSAQSLPNLGFCRANVVRRRGSRLARAQIHERLRANFGSSTGFSRGLLVE